MNIEKICKTLLDNITINSIFYLFIEEDYIFHKIPDLYTNINYKKSMITIDGDLFLYNEDDINVLKLHEKDFLLDTNFYKILELKHSLNKNVFDIVFKEYFLRLEIIIFLNKIAIDNIGKIKEISSDEVIECIKINDLILIKHQEKLFEIEPVICNNILNESVFSNKKSTNDENITNIESSEENIKLIDFIKHEKKEEIEKLIKRHFSNLRGVSLRYLIEFLLEEGLLILNYGDATKLHKALIKLFEGNDIGAYTSIFDKKVFNKDDKNYKSSKITFKKIFKNIL